MIYSIENSKIKITASTHGAELHSITGQKEGTEYLWNGDVKYWKYHAPHLFPIVGKVVDSKLKVDGIQYEMPAHGLARISEFTLLIESNNSLTFGLNYSEDTLKIYPYGFSLFVTYTLEENSIIVTYKVINLDDRDIVFSIGAHPAFMCPIEKGEELEACYLQFNKKETSSIIEVTRDTYLSRKRIECLRDTDTLPLSRELFKDGVLVFDDLKSDKISLKSKNHDKSLSIEFKGFPHLGIWAPETGAPFLCIEPWFGHADYEDFTGEFRDKEGTISLSTDKVFECSYKISIEE